MKKIVRTPLEIEFEYGCTRYSHQYPWDCYATWCCRRLFVAMLPSLPLHKSQVADHIALLLRTGFKYDGISLIRTRKLTPGREILKYLTVHHIIDRARSLARWSARLIILANTVCYEQKP